MPFFKRKEKEPAPAPTNPNARPGVGSDPAPYLPDNQRNWAETPHEPVTRQWKRLGVGVSQDFWEGTTHNTERQQNEQNVKVLYASTQVDDGHDIAHYRDDPYQANPPKPRRIRWIPTGFRELARSVEGSADHMNGTHFSMADNVRTYPIGGMLPVVARRNTFRLEPPPIDINQTDYPPTGDRFDVPDKVTIDVPIGLRDYARRLR